MRVRPPRSIIALPGKGCSSTHSYWDVPGFAASNLAKSAILPRDSMFSIALTICWGRALGGIGVTRENNFSRFSSTGIGFCGIPCRNPQRDAFDGHRSFQSQCLWLDLLSSPAVPAHFEFNLIGHLQQFRIFEVNAGIIPKTTASGATTAAVMQAHVRQQRALSPVANLNQPLHRPPHVTCFTHRRDNERWFLFHTASPKRSRCGHRPHRQSNHPGRRPMGPKIYRTMQPT